MGQKNCLGNMTIDFLGSGNLWIMKRCSTTLFPWKGAGYIKYQSGIVQRENDLPNSEGNISLFEKNVSTFQQWDNFMNHVQGHVGKSAWSSNSSAAKINIVVQFLSQLCIIVVQKVYLSTLSQIRQLILGILWCQSLLQNTHRANPCTVEGTY